MLSIISPRLVEAITSDGAAQIATLQGQLATLQASAATLTDQRDTAQAEVVTLTQQRDDAMASGVAKQGEIDALSVAIGQAQAAVTAAELARDGVLADLQDARDDIAHLEAELAAGGGGGLAPVIKAVPTLSGQAVEGEKLTGSDPVVTGGSITARRIFNASTGLTSAAGGAYVLVASDVGATFSYEVELTSTADANVRVIARSAATGPVIAATASTPAPLTTTMPSNAGTVPISSKYRTMQVDTPQSVVDTRIIEASDPLMHYAIPEAKTHEATKAGVCRWSDTSTWADGIVPGLTADPNIVLFTAAACTELIFDIEMVEGSFIRYLHTSGKTKVTIDPTRDTTLRCYSALFHGQFEKGRPEAGYHIPWSTTPGRLARARLFFDCPSDVQNDASAKGGAMFHGPVRMWGECPMARGFVTSDSGFTVNATHGGLEVVTLAPGATTMKVPGAFAGNWPVGAEILVGDTSYAPDLANTDPSFEGPPTIWGPIGDGFAQLTAKGFRLAHQNERVKIVSIDMSDNITFTPALQYSHRTVRDFLPATNEARTHGVPVFMLSQSIEIRSLKTTTRERAHTMFMHPDSIIGGVAFVDMGRTRNDWSLVRDPYGTYPADDFVTRASQGGPSVIVDWNVKGRYPLHWHRTGQDANTPPNGAYRCTFYTSPGAPPMPGPVVAPHESHTYLKECTVFNFRSSAFWPETGSERGYGVDCNAILGIGTGSPFDYGAPQELFEKQEDNNGCGFGGQARGFMWQGCIGVSCNIAMPYLQSRANIARRTSRRQDLLLANPVTKGLQAPQNHPLVDINQERKEEVAETASYGPKQQPIPLNLRNVFYSCNTVVKGFHRDSIQRGDPIYGVFAQLDAIGCRVVFESQNYAFHYLGQDSMWFDIETGAKMGQPISHVGLSNVTMRGRGAAVVDPFGGSKIQYGGEFIMVNWNGSAWDDPGLGIFNYSGSFADVPYKEVYGAVDLGNGQARLRRWKSLTREEAIANAYPAAPLGRGAGTPIAGKARPYFVDEGTKAAIDWNGGANQLVIDGTIYDNAGADKLGDNQNPESYPTNMGVKGPYRVPMARPMDIIEGSGCYQSGGKWYTAIHFQMTDRGRYGDDPYYFIGTAIRELVNFPADILSKYTVDPEASKPPTTILPPAFPVRPVIIETRAPTITTPSMLTVQENVPLAVLLQSDSSETKWSLDGVDKDKFEIYTVPKALPLLRWAGNTTRDFEAPVDAGGNNVYDVTLVATNPASGTIAQQQTTVAVNDVAEAISSFNDTMLRTGDLAEGNPYWSRSGPVGKLRNNGSGSIVYDSTAGAGGFYWTVPVTSNNSFYAQTTVRFNGATDLVQLLIQMADGNFFFVYHGGGIVRLFDSRVGFLSGSSNQYFAVNDVERVEVSNGVIMLKRNGNLVQQWTPAAFTASGRAGFRLDDRSTTFEAYRGFAMGPV